MASIALKKPERNRDRSKTLDIAFVIALARPSVAIPK